MWALEGQGQRQGKEEKGNTIVKPNNVGVEGGHAGIDRERGMVMAKGTMDVAALAKKLSEKFKRKIEVVLPKKEKEKGKEKESEKEGGGKGENDSAKKKKMGGNGGGREGHNDKGN